MNARVKTVTAAQDAVADEDGLIVVRKLKKRPMFDDDGTFRGIVGTFSVIHDRSADMAASGTVMSRR